MASPRSETHSLTLQPGAGLELRIPVTVITQQRRNTETKETKYAIMNFSGSFSNRNGVEVDLGEVAKYVLRAELDALGEIVLRGNRFHVQARGPDAYMFLEAAVAMAGFDLDE